MATAGTAAAAAKTGSALKGSGKAGLTINMDPGRTITAKRQMASNERMQQEQNRHSMEYSAQRQNFAMDFTKQRQQAANDTLLQLQGNHQKFMMDYTTTTGYNSMAGHNQSYVPTTQLSGLRSVTSKQSGNPTAQPYTGTAGQNMNGFGSIM